MIVMISAAHFASTATHRSLEKKKRPPTWWCCPSFHAPGALLVKFNKVLIVMRIYPAVACLRCRECVVIIIRTTAGDAKNAKQQLPS